MHFLALNLSPSLPLPALHHSTLLLCVYQEPFAPLLAPAPAPQAPLLVLINLGGDLSAPLPRQQINALLAAVGDIVEPIPGITNITYAGSMVGDYLQLAKRQMT